MTNIKIGETLTRDQTAIISEGLCPICGNVLVQGKEDRWTWGCKNNHYFALVKDERNR